MKDLQIIDSQKNTNMLYADGRQPTELTDSYFTGEINNCLLNMEKAKTITSLRDAILYSDSLAEFFLLLFKNIWLLFKWF